MKVQSFFAQEKNDWRDALLIFIDDKVVFSAIDGEPEDNSLGRNFNDCHSITDLIEQAYIAGVDGDEMTIEHKDISWDELMEIY